jgi:hypothetical protein
MTPNLETPTVTAHALGELSETEARLLRMTFHEPHAARDLAEEVAEIQSCANQLRSALQSATQPSQLSQAQREKLLQLAEQKAFTKPSLELKSGPAQHRPKTFTAAVAERKEFERRPARLATYLTGAAAAAALIVLATWETKPTGATGSRTTAGNIDEIQTKSFKVKPASQDSDAKARELQKSTAGVPQSSLDLQRPANLPKVQSPPQSQMTLTTPDKSNSSKPTIPQTVKTPPSPPAGGPPKGENPTFATPK